MNVEVVYCASPTATTLVRVRVADGASVREAVAASRILERHPEIDLERHKVGVFGKFRRLDAPVHDGERVEIYRPISCDPETVPRRDVDARAE